MKSTIDTAALHAFVTVVQAGSFTHAAHALQTHKAHLSRVVGQLERDLGARLLERTTRSLSLTEVGREFHARASAILASLEDARDAVAQSQAEPRGTLRLTCGVEFGMLAANDWIGRYLQRYPQMRVDAEMTSRLVDVVHEGFDLAIRVGRLPDSSLTARRLGALDYALYAAPAYLQRRGAPQAPADLTGHAQLVFAPASGRSHWPLSDGEHTERVPLQPTLRATNVHTVRDAAAQGLGIAVLPRRLAAPLLQDGQLAVVLPRWQPPPVPVHAVFAGARYLAPKVRAFIDLAAQQLEPGA